MSFSISASSGLFENYSGTIGTAIINIEGNASTATALQAPFQLTLSGSVIGTASLTGASNITIPTSVSLQISDISTALGYTPTTPVVTTPGTYNVFNLNNAGQVISASFTSAGSSYISAVGSNLTVSSGTLTVNIGVASFNTRTGAITLTSGDISTALGFAPTTPITSTAGTFNTVVINGAGQVVSGSYTNSITSSSGTTSAGQLVKTNSSGLVDASFYSIGPSYPNLTPYTGLVATLNVSNIVSPASNTPTANLLYFSPFVVQQTTTVNQLGINIYTAGNGQVSIGIYSDSGSGGYNLPSNLLTQVANKSVAGTTGNAFGTLSSPYVLSPNTNYWAGFICSTANPSITGVSGSNSVGLTAELGLNSSGVFITHMTQAGSGSTLPSSFSGTPSFVATAFPIIIYQ